MSDVKEQETKTSLNWETVIQILQNQLALLQEMIEDARSVKSRLAIQKMILNYLRLASEILAVAPATESEELKKIMGQLGILTASLEGEVS
jgi:hypothetical protein